MRRVDRAEEERQSADIANPAEALFANPSNPRTPLMTIWGDRKAPWREATSRQNGQPAKYGILARGMAPCTSAFRPKKAYEEKIWDHAAAAFCGGSGRQSDDLSGKPLDFLAGINSGKNKGIIATNGKLHDVVLKAVKSVISL